MCKKYIKVILLTLALLANKTQTAPDNNEKSNTTSTQATKKTSKKVALYVLPVAITTLVISSAIIPSTKKLTTHKENSESFPANHIIVVSQTAKQQKTPLYDRSHMIENTQKKFNNEEATNEIIECIIPSKEPSTPWKAKNQSQQDTSKGNNNGTSQNTREKSPSPKVESKIFEPIILPQKTEKPNNTSYQAKRTLQQDTPKDSNTITFATSDVINNTQFSSTATLEPKEGNNENNKELSRPTNDLLEEKLARISPDDEEDLLNEVLTNFNPNQENNNHEHNQNIITNSPSPSPESLVNNQKENNTNEINNNKSNENNVNNNNNQPSQETSDDQGKSHKGNEDNNYECNQNIITNSPSPRPEPLVNNQKENNTNDINNNKSDENNVNNNSGQPNQEKTDNQYKSDLSESIVLVNDTINSNKAFEGNHATNSKRELKSSYVQIKKHQSLDKNDSGFEIVENPEQITLEEYKNAAKNLLMWFEKGMKDKKGEDRQKTENTIKTIVEGCIFYSKKTQQEFSEGTFCVVDPNKHLTKYIYENNNIISRVSSHLKGITTQEHKGFNPNTPIMVGAKKKRTILFISYKVNGKNMLLIKPENYTVWDMRHLFEFVFSPSGEILVNRKERGIKKKESTVLQEITKQNNFNEKEYKTYGISYLHKNNYLGNKKFFTAFLAAHKLDHPEIRIGKEVIITPKQLRESYNTTETYFKLQYQ